jgi:GT2 family glycosyltransferase
MSLNSKDYSPLVSVVIPTHERSNQLRLLLSSIANSNYTNIEVIIINNGTNPLADDIRDSIPERTLRVVENGSNMGLAHARNQGARVANGTFVLFIDDDNILAPNMVTELVEHFDTNTVAVGPLTFYKDDPESVWFSGATLNLWTSKPAFARYTKAQAEEQEFLQTEILHNCLMVRKKDGDSVGWFDKVIFMAGTEYDLLMRLRRLSDKSSQVAIISQAHCYHDVPRVAAKSLRSMGFTNHLRVYYFQRNRGLLCGRYGNIPERVVLAAVFYPFFFLLYSVLFVVHGRFDFVSAHARGTVVGYLRLFNSHS